MEDRKNIILIGMCYSGKTTLGNLLSTNLKREFIDFADFFKKVFKVSEDRIFIRKGSYKLFKMEEEMMMNHIDKKRNSVISTSGSAIYSQEGMNIIKKHGIIVYLNVSYSTIETRKREINDTRPIVFPPSITKFEDLYNTRKELYEKYADITINIEENYSISDIYKNLLFELNKYLKNLILV